MSVINAQNRFNRLSRLTFKPQTFKYNDVIAHFRNWSGGFDPWDRPLRDIITYTEYASPESWDTGELEMFFHDICQPTNN